MDWELLWPAISLPPMQEILKTLTRYVNLQLPDLKKVFAAKHVEGLVR